MSKLHGIARKATIEAIDALEKTAKGKRMTGPQWAVYADRRKNALKIMKKNRARMLTAARQAQLKEGK